MPYTIEGICIYWITRLRADFLVQQQMHIRALIFWKNTYKTGSVKSELQYKKHFNSFSHIVCLEADSE